MKYIQLSQNKQAIVDDEDYAELSKYNWHLANGYVVRHVSAKPDIREYMHRAVNGTPKGLVTDHINGDKLDNRRINLRTATATQNAMNYSKQKNSKNPYRGVSLHKRSGLWRARLRVEKQEILLGYFKTPEEARTAYETTARDVYGEFFHRL